MKVSIIIPIIRQDKAERCLAAVMQDVTVFGSSVEVLAEPDTDSIGCPRMVKKLTDKANGDCILFLGDDTIPQSGFLIEALRAMSELPDGWGLVALNDGISGGLLATHWLADRRLLEALDGEFFHTGYNHCFCDKELTDRAKELGRYIYAPDAKIIHDHPHRTGEPYDDGYKKAYARENFEADQHLYWRRKIERVGGLAIGVPLIDQTVPSNFFVSVMAMDKPAEFTLLVPRYSRESFPESIASVRNDIVEQALEHGCSHLLMMDTDQVYPPDTLSKLVSHGKPVVGVAVHRRWPPFDRIMLRGNLGEYQKVSDSEAYSGELVSVDATGTGCVLFDTHVFLSVKRPWFEFSAYQGKPVGEDINFCSKLRKAGIPIFVDTNAEVDHLTTFRVNSGLAKLFQKFSETQHGC